MRDLAERWPRMEAIEKDAAVAQALGYKVAWQGLTAESRLPYVHENGKLIGAPRPFSRSWVEAGALLDRLREAGWKIRIQAVPEPWRVEILLPPAFDVLRRNRHISAEGATGPDAIALAFCLAREATR